MDIRIQNSTNFKSKYEILESLRTSSKVVRQMDKVITRDLSIGNDIYKSNRIFKGPILSYIEKIVNDSDFTESIVDSFTKDELKEVKENLNNITNKQGFKDTPTLFRAFFNEYLTNRFMKGENTNIAAYEEKMDIVNSLVEKLQ